MTDSIWDVFKRTANKYSDKRAFCCETEEMIFKQAYKRSAAIATSLIRLDVFNKPVAVYMDKTPDMLSVMLALFAAGGIYAPIEYKSMPKGRTNKIIKDLKPKLIICDKKSQEDISEGYKDINIVTADKLASAAIDEALTDKIKERISTDTPAYVMYTSGSTGEPKGVLASHGNVISYAKAFTRGLKINESNVFANQAPFNVDASLKEILSVIFCGSSLWIIPKGLFMSPVNLIEYLNKKKINTLCWSASALVLASSFDAFSYIKPSYLKLVAAAAEELPVRQLMLWKNTINDCEFYNLYGPTETTGVCCYYNCSSITSDSKVLPIGKPFENANIRLKDDGEIIISGEGVACGYYNDKELTDKHFKMEKGGKSRCFYTGDIARYDGDGNLVFEGRRDEQIKRNGYRIELRELERTAESHKNVAVARCIFEKKRQRLYLVYSGTAFEDEVRIYIKENLPKYMYPYKIIKTDEFAYTTNGKIDRSKLIESFKREGLYEE